MTSLFLPKAGGLISFAKWRETLSASGIGGDKKYFWAKIPSDFATLDEAYIYLNRAYGDTGTLDIDLHSAYSLDDDLEYENSEDDTTNTISVTSTELIKMDISSVFQNLSSSHQKAHVGLTVINQAATTFYIGMGEIIYTNVEGVKKTQVLITTYFDTQTGASTCKRPANQVLSTENLDFNFQIPKSMARVTRAVIDLRKGSSGSGSKTFTFTFASGANGEGHAENTVSDTIDKTINTGIRMVEIDILPLLEGLIPGSSFSGGVLTLPVPFDGISCGGNFTNSAGIAAQFCGGALEGDF